MLETTLMTYSSWQDNTDRLLPKKQQLRKHKKNCQRWMLVGATPQGMLLCSHLVQICGNTVCPKYPLVSVINGKGMPKSLQAISKLMSSVEIKCLPNLIPKMAIQSRGRTTYSPQLKWKVLVLVWIHCTKASLFPCLMVYRGIRRKSLNPYSLRKSA